MSHRHRTGEGVERDHAPVSSPDPVTPEVPRSGSAVRRSWWGTFAVVWVLLVVPASVWAVVTPVFGVADEGAHVINAAAAVRGQALTQESVSEPGSAYRSSPVVAVPGYLAEAETASECFEREPSVPMTCAPPFDGDPAQDQKMVTHAGNYPPLFYLAVGWVTFGLDGADAVVGMRLVSAWMCAAVVAAAAATLRLVYTGRGAIAAILLATTPMAVSLFGSVNPSGLETALAVALWCGMLTFATPSRVALDARLLFVGVSAALLANARPASMLWAAVIVLVGLVLVTPPVWRLIWGRRAFFAAVGVAAAGAAASVIWYLLADPGASIGGTGRAGHPELSTLSGVQQAHLDNLPGYSRALVGNLGWLDAPLPWWAVTLYGLAALGLVWTAIVHASGRQVAALVLAVLFLLETPVLVQFPDASTVGLIWQGRYSLPLWVGIPLTAYTVLALRQDGLPVRGLAERATVPALAVVLVVHAVMFRVAVPRFYVGLREPMELGAAPGYVGWALASLVVPALLLLVVLTPARLLPARLSRAGARDGALTS